MNIGDFVTLEKPAHSDERRTIWEPVNGNKKFVRLNFFNFAGAVKPGGNHYHIDNEEVFFITAGLVKTLVIENIGTRQRFTCQSSEKETRVTVSSLERENEEVILPFPLGAGVKIEMPVGFAHAFFFEPGSQMIAFCSEAFDPTDTDMHPYPLLDADGEELPRELAEKVAL